MRCVALWLALFAAASPATAQRGRGNQDRARQIDTAVTMNGRVTMPDGSPPPATVTIVRACQGHQTPEGYTQPDGGFGFRIGRETYIAMEDAASYGVDSRGRASGDTLSVGGITGDTERFSIMKNRGSVDLTGCEIRAVLDGYTAAAIPLTRRNIFDNPDLGVIVLHPIVADGRDAVSVTTALAPKTAQKNFERGAKELARTGGDAAKAAAFLEKAVEEHTAFAEAWEKLGAARIRLRDESGALEAYRQAVNADSGYAESYPVLIRLLMRAQEWQELADASEAYLRRNPAARQERFYRAVAMANLGRPEAAEAALEPLFSPAGVETAPEARHFKASLMAQRGDYAGASEQLEALLARSPEAPQADEARRILAEWKALGIAR